MGDEPAAPTRRKRLLDERGKVLRRGRIFARLREATPVTNCGEEQPTPERVHEVMREALGRRIVDDETRPRGGERKNGPGGPRKPLKTLDSAKEIQGFSFVYLVGLCWIWLQFGSIWIWL